MNMKVEKGDIVALKDGREVEILAVKPDYEHPGAIMRFDYIYRKEASPMRRTEYPSCIVSILRKGTPPIDPKAVRPGDNRQPAPTKVIIVDGKRYVEKPADGPQGAVPLTPGVGTQVHPAVKAPAKPVISRIKKAGKVATAAAAQSGTGMESK
jgi:hypothetical protein